MKQMKLEDIMDECDCSVRIKEYNYELTLDGCETNEEFKKRLNRDLKKKSIPIEVI